MKVIRTPLMLGIALVGMGVAALEKPAAMPSQGSAKDPLALIRGYESWPQATSMPHLITPSANQLCRPASLPAGPHKAGFIEVYVSKPGYKSFVSNKSVPVGTVVVKKKFPELNAKPDLLTVMVKVAGGDSLSDWNFYTTSGDGKRRLDAKVETCQSCHANAGEDHLFRTYAMRK